MKKYLLLFAITISNFFSTNVSAQIPPGYYNAANGLSGGVGLKSALHTIIKDNHTAIGYAALWNAFTTTDVKPNGKLWDIYSFKFSGAQPYEYTLISDQCGQYSAEGDCYNREHTWPQTFFGALDPMVSDLHQVLPTDGSVNGIHGNDPYGPVNIVNKTTMNGSKSGTSSAYPSWSNSVFEPIDSFKGDIARCYFYMATRYYTEDAAWGSWTMANGAELTPAAITVLLAWHHLDPVSGKEVDRNDEVYNIQGNRNPFIDHPEYVDCIWGTTSCGTISIKTFKAQNFDLFVSANELTILGIDVINNINIYNVGGQNILQQKNVSDKIDISNLQNGIYFLKAQYQNKSISKVFIKK